MIFLQFKVEVSIFSDCVLFHQEREERTQRIRKTHPDDKPSYGYRPTPHDDGYQVKRQRPNNRLPPGKVMPIMWVSCVIQSSILYFKGAKEEGN